MSHFSRADLDRLAALAHLELDDREAAALTRQLGDILAYAEQVRTAATEDVPPTTHVMTPRARLREDAPADSLPTRVALDNAPDADLAAGLFKVPRVIGG